MSKHGLTAENMLRSLPAVLQRDEKMRAIGAAVAEVLMPLIGEADRARIFPCIDTLEEPLLDSLAWDFKVDWWDYGYSLAEKRDTLKGCWYVHKHMGTPAAVAAALSAIYPGTRIEEWWQYGGKPYHFRLVIPTDETMLDLKKHSRALAAVAFYKNLRSILDSVEYYGASTSISIYPAAAVTGIHVINWATQERRTYLVDELNQTLVDELNEILLDSE